MVSPGFTAKLGNSNKSYTNKRKEILPAQFLYVYDFLRFSILNYICMMLPCIYGYYAKFLNVCILNLDTAPCMQASTEVYHYKLDLKH